MILASWELSKPEKSRAELGAVLGRSGIQAYWPQLDLMSKELTPFVDACRNANSPIGSPTQSRDFLRQYTTLVRRLLAKYCKAQISTGQLELLQNAAREGRATRTEKA